MMALTRDLVGEVVEEASWTRRARGIERIAGGTLSETEHHAVAELFRMVLYDGEPLVRRILAESLKACSALPRDIALALAHDGAEVAAPVLEHSPLLDEAALIEIVAQRSPQHRLAVARRTPLPGAVADALCRRGEPRVLLLVLANPGATIPEGTLAWLLDHAPAEALPAIRERLAAGRSAAG